MTQPVIDQIHRSKAVVDAGGVRHPVHSHIDAAEGRFLAELIAGDPSISKTLEIGCAYGLSALHITGALAGRHGAHHTIVDPHQNTDWSGIGVANLRRAGIDYFDLIEQPSEVALPKLVADGAEFDLVFVDGWHTFDHTLLDVFYANRLVKVGGYIVIDDCGWRSVSKVVSYFAKYPCFEIVGGADSTNVIHRAARYVGRKLRPLAAVALPHWLYDHVFASIKHPSMVALKKISSDDRDWKWFVSF
ncbi:MAG: class I SAM-dependent methyltransferase [Mycobacterium sp.]